jgi:hypothetical protein
MKNFRFSLDIIWHISYNNHKYCSSKDLGESPMQEKPMIQVLLRIEMSKESSNYPGLEKDIKQTIQNQMDILASELLKCYGVEKMKFGYLEGKENDAGKGAARSNGLSSKLFGFLHRLAAVCFANGRKKNSGSEALSTGGPD